jgi:hypothetical protein
MTSLMLRDVTNPPLAARFYAYAMLAGYEVVAQHDSSNCLISRQLKDYPAIPRPEVRKYSVPLASLLAMLQTAGQMQPSGKLLDSCRHTLIEKCRREGMPDAVIKASELYSITVAKAILAYARQDGYASISDYARYTPSNGDGYWFPTPPAFFAPVEPYFNKVRPFVLTSSNQFKPQVPTPFQTEKGSNFYQLMQAVYQQSKTLTAEQRTIAAFWDCNPFALQEEGHLQIGIKKISPGGHWMGIAGIACKAQNIPFNKAVQIHAMLAVTLMDAFIGCWDEKYRSNRIRPETAIRRYLDPGWTPLLQTPPFPEYLSGHSVVSAAAAEVLTHYFGAHFAYTDSVEVPYGLPPRKFNSFRGAAAEAGLSRFYGGIHFMDAIGQGQRMGQQIGSHIVNRLTSEQYLPKTRVALHNH